MEAQVDERPDPSARFESHEFARSLVKKEMKKRVTTLRTQRRFSVTRESMGS